MNRVADNLCRVSFKPRIYRTCWATLPSMHCHCSAVVRNALNCLQPANSKGEYFEIFSAVCRSSSLSFRNSLERDAPIWLDWASHAQFFRDLFRIYVLLIDSV